MFLMKKIALFSILFFCLISPITVFARSSAGEIIVDPQDNPLEISGWLEEQNAFSGSLRLIAGQDLKDEVSILFLPSDLILRDSDLRIDRNNIRVTGDPVLKPGIPKDFTVTITGIKEAGNYTGSLTIMPEGETMQDAVVVDIAVFAKERPQVNLLSDSKNVQLRLVNCENCFLGNVLSDSAFLNQWLLKIENLSATDIVIEKFDIAGVGTKTGFQFTNQQIQLPDTPETLPARQIGSIPLTLSRIQMPADHYTGSIYLTLADKKEPVTIPFDINVRKGPGAALLCLLFGVVLGWFARYMQNRGKPLIEQLEALDRLQVRIEGLSFEDRQILLPMVEDARKFVYQERLEIAQTRRNAIESRMEILLRVTNIQELVEKHKPENLKELQKQIKEIRDAIMLKEDEEAEKKLKLLNQLILTPVAGSTMMGLENHQKPSGLFGVDEQRVSLLMEQTQAAVSWLMIQSQKLKKAGSWLPKLTGWRDMLWSQLLYRVLRPVFYLLLLAGLLAVGLNTLYIEGNPSFGAVPFSDYLALVLWGLSADVAGRTLTNLTGGK